MYTAHCCIIWGEPERAPNTWETGSSVYSFIYLYVILHSNRLMRMLKHQPLDSKDRQDAGTCKGQSAVGQ